MLGTVSAPSDDRIGLIRVRAGRGAGLRRRALTVDGAELPVPAPSVPRAPEGLGVATVRRAGTS